MRHKNLLSTCRHLFLDLLLHSGSNAGLILLRDLIREGGHLDEMTAARLTAYAGAYVKQPSEKLLQELLGLMTSPAEAKLVGGEPLGVFRNAAVLAVSSLIGKTCGDGSCRSVRIDDYRKSFLDKVTSATLTYAERALYAHALRNVGYGSAGSMDSILDLIGRPGKDGPSNDIRLYLILGLQAQQSKVFNLFHPFSNSGADEFKKFSGRGGPFADLEGRRRELSGADCRRSGPFGRAFRSGRFGRHEAIGIGRPDERPGASLHRHGFEDAGRESEPMQPPLVSHERTATLLMDHSLTIGFFRRKDSAQQALNSWPAFKTASPTYSSENAFDFFEPKSSLGSQLMLRSTVSETDDLPGFVSGRLLYFLKSSTALEPYAVNFKKENLNDAFYLEDFSFQFTVRMSGMRRQTTGLFAYGGAGATLRKEDLNLDRLHEILSEDLNFSPPADGAAAEPGASADVAFKLHGTTVMFYHFDKQFLQTAMTCTPSPQNMRTSCFNPFRFLFSR